MEPGAPSTRVVRLSDVLAGQRDTVVVIGGIANEGKPDQYEPDIGFAWACTHARSSEELAAPDPEVCQAL